MISVCMTTYNGERFLKKQLDSVLNQLGAKDEIIISDDASADQTLSIIKSYDDKRIRLFENKTRKGPLLNVENALKKAKGDFIFLADQDDVWLPGRVTKTLSKLEDYDLVVCNAYIVDQNEKILHESYFQWKGSSTGFLKNIKKNSFIGCAMAFNRKILNISLPFPEHIAMHDIWIGLLAELTGRVFFLDERLLYYRRHEKNFTAAVHKSDKQLSDFNFLYKIRYRFVLLYYLMKRILMLNSKKTVSD